MVRANPRTDEPPEDLRGLVGRTLDDVPTPALVLDLAAARRNIETMATRMAAMPAGLRPHIKAHKSAELARWQLDAGAIGVTTATVAEAVAMARSGVPDILVANQVVHPASIAWLLSAARDARVRVAVDDAGNLAALGAAAVAGGAELGVLVELDVGLGRGGTRSVADAVALAERAADTPGVTFDGLMGYEGHIASEADVDVRTRGTLQSMGLLAEAVRACRDAGLTVPTVSGGSTGTCAITGNAAELTEVQAGSYVLMDRFHAPLIDGFAFALTVAATVIGRHGDLVIVDAGRKCMEVELRPPLPSDPDATLAFANEEHMGFTYGGPAPGLGDRVRLVPGYAPTTVNLFGSYLVVEGERIIDVWPVLARHGTP